MDDSYPGQAESDISLFHKNNSGKYNTHQLPQFRDERKPGRTGNLN